MLPEVNLLGFDFYKLISFAGGVALVLPIPLDVISNTFLLMFSENLSRSLRKNWPGGSFIVHPSLSS